MPPLFYIFLLLHYSFISENTAAAKPSHNLQFCSITDRATELGEKEEHPWMLADIKKTRTQNDALL